MAVKTTFICTVLNEEKTISHLLSSLSDQTVMPDEIIIVDGGSTDNTLSEIFNFQFSPRSASGRAIFNEKKPKIKILKKPGNRSVGRNFAIKNASNTIILCSDAGCVLDPKWTEEMISFFKKNVDVVAGYYKGKYATIFEKCIIPYVLVMEDRLNEKSFLPAARSIGFNKKIWEKAGGFPEEYSHNEDFVFAKRLEKIKARMVFNKKALVYWCSPHSIYSIFRMFYRFALGDIESGIIRPKVLLIYCRYILGLIVLYNNVFLAVFILLGYFVWAVLKNYRYVNHPLAFVFLPFLQIFSDCAVMGGSVVGLFRRLF